MASKRNYEGSDTGEVTEPTPKRSKKHNSKTRDHQNAHIDPTWGQKYVFSASDGATTVPVDPDLDFEDDADAMAYLKSVRTQANGIPHLLVAPKVPIGPQLPRELQTTEVEDGEVGEAEDERGDIYTSGQGDFRGYYYDGAYTARPADWDEKRDYRQEDGEWMQGDDDEDDEATLHKAYFASILSRFNSLRAALHTSPPPSAVAALPPTHDYHVSLFRPKASPFAVWSERLNSWDPMPAQVASMDKDGVLRVIRVLLGGKFLRRGCELRERTSRWLWALLARLPERGELTHVEIGWIRDLGRRAVLMMRSLAEMAALRDALEEEGMDLGVHDAVDESSDDEDVLAEMEDDDGDGEIQGQEKEGETPSKVQEEPETTKESVEAINKGMEDGEVEEGEIDDDQKSEPMDVSEDGEMDEGEVTEEEAAPAETLEEARARLLARLDSATADAPTEAVDEDDEKSSQLRARMNMRATLNMILTVAGELYGQRDLLEFRDPFTGM